MISISRSATFAPMSREHPKKKQAYKLFVEQGLDAREIHEMLGISENTISKWRGKENWDKQRAIRQLSPDKLISHYYEQSEKIVRKAKEEERALSASEADALNKLASAIQKLDKKVDSSISMSVLRNFNNWLVQINPEAAKTLIEFQTYYVQFLIDAEK